MNQSLGLANSDSSRIDFIAEKDHLANRLAAAHALCLAIAECEPEDAAFVISGILDRMGAGMPSPGFLSAMDEARWWARFATPGELKAYALAAFEAMRPKVQRDFLDYAKRQVAQ